MSKLMNDAKTTMEYLKNGYMPSKHTDFAVNTVAALIEELENVPSEPEVTFTPDFDINEKTLSEVIIDSLKDIKEVSKEKPVEEKVVSKEEKVVEEVMEVVDALIAKTKVSPTKTGKILGKKVNTSKTK